MPREHGPARWVVGVSRRLAPLAEHAHLATMNDAMRPAAWLLKTEPGTYSFDDLVREGRTVWDGVTNPVALRNVGAMREGDRVVIYHTGKEKSAVGTARVVRAPYTDSRSGDRRLTVVDLEAGTPFQRVVSLAELKASPVFAESPLVRQGRLSVVPLTRDQWSALQALARGGGAGARPPVSAR